MQIKECCVDIICELPKADKKRKALANNEETENKEKISA